MAKDNSFIAIDPIDLARITKLVEDFPPLTADYIGDSLAPYLVNIMRAYPPYKYVSRKKAYGVTFFSDKQRKWFFAALRSGELQIPYQRTQTLRDGWQVLGSGKNSLVVNETPYAYLVQGDRRTQQSRHPRAIGWRSIDEVVEKHKKKIIGKINAAIKKGLKQKR